MSLLLLLLALHLIYLIFRIEGLGKIGSPLSEEEAKRLAQVSVRFSFGKQYDTITLYITD
jgi:hypothetical protein